MTVLMPDATPRRRRWRGALASAIAVVLLAPLLTFMQAAPAAEAASGSDFSAGNIISDAVFYNSKSMTVGQVQSFLNAQVPNCRAGYTCLKDYRSDSAYKPAQSAGCAVYPGPASQSAAEIIWQVASVCGINPQVLLVLLEKEQGLVSDTWPTARQYRSATGFACPDTADCDPSYYGLFNQLYQAAFQYKKYQATPAGRNFVAGRTNTIQWSPNSACGSSQVYIENQATAGLYNYTPYRPNTAALANMYGTGDACSTYGNRNFFRMFTDWFGSTRGGGDFARTADNGALYLLSGSTKYPVPTMAVYDTLKKLGPYRIVSQNYLDTFTTSSKPASAVVRDPATGAVYVMRDGSRHQFPSCAVASAYGYDCGAGADLTPTQLAKLPVGGALTEFFTVSNGVIFMLGGGGRYQMMEWNTVVKLNGGKSPYIWKMSADAAAKIPLIRAVMEPKTLVKSANNPAVFYLDGFERKLPVPSFGVAAEFGSTGYTVVSQALLDGYPTGSTLSQTITCGTGAFFVAGGGRYELTKGAGPLGTPVVAMASCGSIPKKGTISGPLFVISPGNPNVYGIQGGAAHLVPSWSALLALNSGTAPSIITISAESRNAIKTGSPYLASGTLARTKGNPTIYLIDGTKAVPVASFTTTAAFGITTWASVADDALALHTPVSGTLTRVVQCGSTGYFASAGKLYKLSGSSQTGITATTLSTSTCALIPVGSQSALGRVFVKSSDSAVVFVLDGGVRRPVSSWAKAIELNGGAGPVVLTERPGSLSDIPEGPAI